MIMADLILNKHEFFILLDVTITVPVQDFLYLVV
jgi:hypothetical protein